MRSAEARRPGGRVEPAAGADALDPICAVLEAGGAGPRGTSSDASRPQALWMLHIGFRRLVGSRPFSLRRILSQIPAACPLREPDRVRPGSVCSPAIGCEPARSGCGAKGLGIG